MREIGGYIEFEHYWGEEYHLNCVALNSGRNCLHYLIKTREIKKIAIPKLVCSAVLEPCQRENIEIIYYSVDERLKPKIPTMLTEDTWIYVINYYGQLDNEFLKILVQQHSKLIVDNAQAFFQKPVFNVDTLYTCRKYFGLSDGAYLYTNKRSEEYFEISYSCDRMNFLMGRFEQGANKFFDEFKENENYLSGQDIRYMSKLTRNILKSIDYQSVRERREKNYLILEKYLRKYNQFHLELPIGPYMYPFYVNNGEKMRKLLRGERIYIPLLWPNVLEQCEKREHEYNYAENILPLPCDQRYTEEDMMFMIQIIQRLMGE